MVWLPVRLLFRLLFAVFGAVGITGTAVQSSQAAGTDAPLETPLGHETRSPDLERAAGDTAWEREQAAAAHEEQDRDRMIDEIGDMAEGSQKHEETNVDDISPEERERQDELPRNPKKRVYEESEAPKDEL